MFDLRYGRFGHESWSGVMLRNSLAYVGCGDIGRSSKCKDRMYSEHGELEAVESSMPSGGASNG